MTSRAYIPSHTLNLVLGDDFHCLLACSEVPCDVSYLYISGRATEGKHVRWECSYLVDWRKAILSIGARPEE